MKEKLLVFENMIRSTIREISFENVGGKIDILKIYAAKSNPYYERDSKLTTTFITQRSFAVEPRNCSWDGMFLQNH